MVTDFKQKIQIAMANKLIYKIATGALLLAFVAACKKTDLQEAPRIFRPVIKGSLESEGNYIDAAWERMEGTVSFTAQISADSFKTILRSVTLDSAHYLFDNLLWDKSYRIQVRGNAADTNKSSGWAYLGEKKTIKFPTILNTPGPSDVITNQVRISWQTEGAAVTGIKILKASDSSVVRDVALTPADVNDNYKIVGGLTPATPYIIYLYSDNVVRGWADFTTSDQLIGTIVDLTGITDRPRVLLDTLPFIEAGATVLLKKGMTYTINSSLALNKAVTITSGDDLETTVPPILYFTANFTFAASSNVDYVRFEKLTMRSDNYGSRYIFNVNSPFNAGEISFNGCTIGAFRGVTRLQAQVINVGKFLVNDCKIDSIKDYAVINADGVDALVKEISITNSTIFKSEKIIVSTKPTGTLTSITVTNCTFNEVPWGGSGEAGIGNSLIDCQNQKFTGLITFKNNIVGPGWKRDNVIVRGIRPGTGTIDAAQNYITSDATISVDSPIPDIISYGKSSNDLFTDPANGNFKIKDNTFAGRNISGDPRWRP
jgi:hypothetical protein